MNQNQVTARVFGVVFVLVGVPGVATTRFSLDSARLLGLFPVNVLHNLVHLAFGGWGLLAGGAADRAATYCRLGGIAYVALAVVWILTPTGFGLVPLGGHDVWPHAVLAGILMAAGFLDRPRQAALHG